MTRRTNVYSGCWTYDNLLSKYSTSQRDRHHKTLLNDIMMKENQDFEGWVWYIWLRILRPFSVYSMVDGSWQKFFSLCGRKKNYLLAVVGKLKILLVYVFLLKITYLRNEGGDSNHTIYFGQPYRCLSIGSRETVHLSDTSMVLAREEYYGPFSHVVWFSQLSQAARGSNVANLSKVFFQWILLYHTLPKFWRYNI